MHIVRWLSRLKFVLEDQLGFVTDSRSVASQKNIVNLGWNSSLPVKRCATMQSLVEQYREAAAEARQKASMDIPTSEREEWVRIAEQWEALLRNHEGGGRLGRPDPNFA
jgi:hypothetical protein